MTASTPISCGKVREMLRIIASNGGRNGKLMGGRVSEGIRMSAVTADGAAALKRRRSRAKRRIAAKLS